MLAFSAGFSHSLGQKRPVIQSAESGHSKGIQFELPLNQERTCAYPTATTL